MNSPLGDQATPRPLPAGKLDGSASFVNVVSTRW